MYKIFSSKQVQERKIDNILNYLKEEIDDLNDQRLNPKVKSWLIAELPKLQPQDLQAIKKRYNVSDRIDKKVIFWKKICNDILEIQRINLIKEFKHKLEENKSYFEAADQELLKKEPLYFKSIDVENGYLLFKKYIDDDFIGAGAVFMVLDMILKERQELWCKNINKEVDQLLPEEIIKLNEFSERVKMKVWEAQLQEIHKYFAAKKEVVEEEYKSSEDIKKPSFPKFI